MSGFLLRAACCGACCGEIASPEPDHDGRGFITISMHELERVKIIEAVLQHRLMVVLAAERPRLPVTRSQC